MTDIPEAPAPRRTDRRWMLAVAGASAMAGAGLAFWQQTRQQRATADAARAVKPEALADFWAASLPTPGGGSLAMGPLREQRLVLNFWATWCPPCIREFPVFDAFQASPSGQVWRVVALAVDQMPAVEAFLKKVPVRFDVVVGNVQSLAWSRALGNQQGGLPYTVLLDRGRVVDALLGEVTLERLQAAVGARALA